MKTLKDLREQIQEDLLTYIGGRHESAVWLDGDDLCQIIVDNFKKHENENKTEDTAVAPANASPFF
mgnify:CR=1 FL=1